MFLVCVPFCWYPVSHPYLYISTKFNSHMYHNTKTQYHIHQTNNNNKDQTNVPKEFLAIGGFATLFIIIAFGLSASTISSIVGFLYPAFKSFHALESRSSSDVTQWLIYWVVYSFFSIIEVFVDFLLYWIPFYYAFKIAFLMWAMLPQTRGAKFL